MGARHTLLVFLYSRNGCVEADDDGFYGRVVYYVIFSSAAGFELLNRWLWLRLLVARLSILDS